MKGIVQTLLAGATGALTVTVLMGASGALSMRNDGIRFPDGTVQTTAAASDPRRAFYLTRSTHQPGGSITTWPLEACAPGFHMASLYEILDVSSLRYATDEEGGFNVLRTPDSGVGPPSNVIGWVRTGYNWFSDSTTEGQGNCSLWSRTTGSGTTVELEDLWASPPSVIAPWDSFDKRCVAYVPVWCVAD